MSRRASPFILVAILWGCINLPACGLIGLGLLLRRQRFSVIGGSILALSTILPIAMAILYRIVLG